MLSNPFTGANYFFRGLGLLTKPGVRLYVIIPLSINIILFAALIVFGVEYFNQLSEQYMPQLPDWLQWLYWLIWPMYIAAMLLIAFYTFSLLANLIAAPFNGLLSEAVEHHLTGEKPPESGWKQMLIDFVPDMINELKKIIYFVAWAIPFLVLFLVPVLQLAAPLLWIVFTSWMLAMQYTDYPMANYKIRLTEVRQRLGEKRMTSLGFGGMTMLVTMIPIGNFIVMPAAVAGATIYWVEKLKDAK
jgi:CysZ protein